MQRSQFTKILFDELNIISQANLDGLHKSVDASKLWDGKFKESDVRCVESNRYRHSGMIYQYDILLSIGRLRVEYSADPQDEIKSLEFSYHVPEVNRWFQPLYRNRIERSSIDKANWDTDLKLQKYVAKRFNSLLDAVAKWFSESNINIKNFDKSFSADQTGYHSMLSHLMGASGRVRLCAELHKQRLNDLGMVTNADRISELANLLAAEIRIQLDTSPAFAKDYYNESY